MKTLSTIATFFSALTLMACGAGDSATTQSSEGGIIKEARSAEEPPKGRSAGRPSAGPPKVTVPPGPPPDHLVIKDLKKGSGLVTKPYSRLAVNFVAVDYKSRKVFETQWSRPFIFEYDHGLPMSGWEKGLRGMKVEGRRHIVVPSRLAYGQGALVYVVDLLSVEDRSKYARPRG